MKMLGDFFCVVLLIVLQVLYTSGKKEDDTPLEKLGHLAEGVVAMDYVPSQYTLLPAKDLSTATQAGIKDVLNKKWLLRVDKPHGSMKSAHININHAITKVRDPHVKIPDAAVSVLSGSNQVLQTVGQYAYGASLIVDGIRLTSSIAEDGGVGKETVKTAASISGGYAGGYGGAYMGGTAGGWIGGVVGSLFFGFGAAPGAAIGSLVGTVVGGITGAGVGSHIAEEVVT